MIPLIAEHTEQIAEICRRHHVKRLDVFGSAAVGDFNLTKATSTSSSNSATHPVNPGTAITSTSKKTSNPSSTAKSTSSTTPRSKTHTSENPSKKPESKSMRRDPKCFLWDIQQAAEAILEYVSGKSFEDYEQQRMLRSAVEREFVTIGEATNRLAHHDEDLAAKITNHEKIISLRNIIAHEYDDVKKRPHLGSHRKRPANPAFRSHQPPR